MHTSRPRRARLLQGVQKFTHTDTCTRACRGVQCVRCMRVCADNVSQAFLDQLSVTVLTFIITR